jgi:hypothetical protein
LTAVGTGVKYIGRGVWLCVRYSDLRPFDRPADRQAQDRLRRTVSPMSRQAPSTSSPSGASESAKRTGQAKSPSLAQDILMLGDLLPHAGVAGVPAAAARPAVALGGGVRRVAGAGGDAGAAAGGGGERRDYAGEARVGPTPPRYWPQIGADQSQMFPTAPF